MTGEIFWKRVSNASRFLDDAIDELLSGRSVVLTFEDDIPWKDVMLDVLAEKLLPCLNTCSLDPYTAEGVTDPGEFLLRRYFNARDRSNYWPGSGSVEKFMAEQNSTMHRRIILITDIPETRSHAWITSVSEYLRYADTEEHAHFLLITSGTTFTGSENISVQSYCDYISEYDCLMLCMNLLSDVNVPSSPKSTLPNWRYSWQTTVWNMPDSLRNTARNCSGILRKPSGVFIRNCPSKRRRN